MEMTTELSLSRTEKETKETASGKKAQERNAISWEHQMLRSEKQAALKLGLQVAQRTSDERNARVETLRAQVNAGTYQVDSQMLAEKMLLNDHRLFNDG